jgi:DNA-binding transcriptional ArsR family regulator
LTTASRIEEIGATMDTELVQALSHPIRLEILAALTDRVASPVELSAEIGEKPGVVSYHANTLVRCGCLELVHSKARRGGIENFFAITPRCFPNWLD